MEIKKKDFICTWDYSPTELEDILELGFKMKKNPELFRHLLKGKTLGMIFQKHSTRTRVSFEVGMNQLGGTSFYYGPGQLQLARGESIQDTAIVLSRYLNAMLIRTFSHQEVLDFAKYARIPVINGLTDFNHPCQAMADCMTMQENFGSLKGLKLAYLGVGNNVATSLAFTCVKMGVHITLVTPKEYALPEKILHQVKVEAAKKRIHVEVNPDIVEGVAGAHIIYTDQWTSMGQEFDESHRQKTCRSYTVTEEVMQRAEKNAIFMHCLPARRGAEVDASVIDGPQSAVLNQAENRLHAQKAILWTLLR